MKRKVRIPANIYRDTETGMLVKKNKSGTGRFLGMYLGQPMKKGLFTYVTDYSKEAFWLDDHGFERVEEEK